MKPYNWQCPFCHRFSVVTDANRVTAQTTLDKGQRGGFRIIDQEFIICSNPDCQQFSFKVNLYRSATGRIECSKENLEHTWNLLPYPDEKFFPDCIPKPQLADYQEAVRLKPISRRASAALALHCLDQLFLKRIRSKKKLKKGKPFQNVREPFLKRVLDEATTVEGIGLLLEKGINLDHEIRLDQVEKLIWLIEVLFKEFYIIEYEKNRQFQPKK
jgi:hypothetical protein